MLLQVPIFQLGVIDQALTNAVLLPTSAELIVAAKGVLIMIQVNSLNFQLFLNENGSKLK